MKAQRGLLILLSVVGLSTVVMIAAAYTVVAIYNLPVDTRDRSPVQPIDFSHRLHAGDHGIPCLFCHWYASKSRSAGIPDMETCVACHQWVGKDLPKVQEVLKLWEEKKPIEWIRVHDLPDFVYFPHRAHVAAGVACGTCHGPVEAMDRIQRVSSLTMGWCLGCHNRNRAGIDCWTCHQ